jgi:hypothetical protein
MSIKAVAAVELEQFFLTMSEWCDYNVVELASLPTKQQLNSN